MIDPKSGEYITIAVIALLFIGMSAAVIVRIIDKRQKKFNKDFANSDMNLCPKTAKYLSDYQQKAVPWAFAFAGALISGVVILGLLSAIKYGKLIDISFSWLLILFFIISIIIFLAIYKVQNCYLARMCGMGSCIDPYFKNSPSPSPK